MSNITERALRLFRYLPRVNLENVQKSPWEHKNKTLLRSKYGKKSWIARGRYPPVGYEHNVGTPFYMRVPIEDYYKDIKHRRQHPPLSLYQLQLLIDNGQLDVNQPIDLASICLTNHYKLDPKDNQYGIHLTDEGMDVFKAKVNIEVQHANEQVIAAVERNGGTIVNAYFDIVSVHALHKPRKWFLSGQPIPKRLLPPPDCIGFYTDPKSRGYLADPALLAEERFKLAQKYGYELPDLTKDPKFKMLTLRKDPRQVFYGLEPGWVVNLADQQILKPTNRTIRQYYNDLPDEAEESQRKEQDQN